MAFQRYDWTSMGQWNNWGSAKYPGAKYPGISHFPNYFIGPLVCWSHAGLIVPLKGPSKSLMACARGRLVGIAKIPRTRSCKYHPPDTCTFIQSVYTVFTLWNTKSVGISLFWQDRLWLGLPCVHTRSHGGFDDDVIAPARIPRIPNTAVFW